MVAKIRQSVVNSPNPTKSVVGEIDTSPPIQSVKDAVSLFAEGALSGEKPVIKKAKSYFAESVWAKESQLHLAQKELNKLKEQLKNAETTKAQVEVELEKAKRVVEELTQKLKVLGESRDSAIQATEASNSQAKQLKEEKCGDLDGTNGAWKEELETAVKGYTSTIKELDVAKQELSKIRQGYDLSLEARVSALKEAAEAEDAMNANTERASELSKEILAVQESIEPMKAASVQAQLQEETLAEHNALRQSYEAKLEEIKKNLLDLKKEFDPEVTKNLEVQLSERMNEIAGLQEQMESTKKSDLDSLRSGTLELGDAKELLLKLSGQENSVRSTVEALKMELENVQREHYELEEKESKTETIVESMRLVLQKSEAELEAYMTEESKARGASEEMILTLNQLMTETEQARRETQAMKNEAAELKMEAEVTKLVLENAEMKLKEALEEAEEAKAAEASALDQIRVLSGRTSDGAHSSTSECGAKITISKEEFESLVRKAKECDTLAEIKVAAATTQVEAAKASESEVQKRLEETQKEIEDIKTETQEAIKRANMADAARRAVESELRKWREREQKKEVASRILAERLMSPELSPQHYRIQRQNSPPNKVEMKLEKGKVSVSKKVLLPNISGIFHRKKNQVDGGSPYLPGENPQ